MTLKPSRAFMGSFFPVLLYLAMFVIWMPNPVSMAVIGSVLFLWLGVLLYLRNRTIDKLDKEWNIVAPIDFASSPINSISGRWIETANDSLPMVPVDSLTHSITLIRQ